MAVPQFTRVISEIRRVHDKIRTTDLQQDDRRKILAALHLFERLQLDYHGSDDDEEEDI